MRNPETEIVDYIAGDRSRGKRGNKPGSAGVGETPGAPPPSDGAAAEAAAPSAMIEEGERPDSDRGSVEGPASANRSGGMIGEG